ncbi:hypothetical protein L3Y34_012944 [Caenorhabditis briggsae]|uniref:Uncharacterized protein n=1 Tax=Caenorhabditis briggsae TaxID=6238 RepID=A0AAE8ZVQ7_CAEBR|nr:hypothetical protein L3Y34_012944 [Caenorhabditis briggsae]
MCQPIGDRLVLFGCVSRSAIAPDDVLKELGLFMSPDNTPKKRQRHSSHEKDEYSSSKKRKYHDDSGIDQVKCGSDVSADRRSASAVRMCQPIGDRLVLFGCVSRSAIG